MLYPYRHKLPMWLWHIVLLLTSADFACHAEVQVCGGNLTQPYGVITSPDYPKLNYTGNLVCVYIIRRPSGVRITLTFMDFCLEEDTDCKYDYVEIRDGETSSSPLLGRRFCGASIPKDQRTSQNIMRITFTSDHSQTCRGFNASFTSDTTLALLTTTNPSNIFYTDLTFRSLIKIPAANANWPVGIGYDPVDDRIYWTDLESGKRNIFSAFLNGTNTTLVRAFGSESSSDSIAVDFLSRLLFYTDFEQKIIAMITMSSLEHKVLINRALKWPRDIVLDTINGVMFWTDHKWPKIERANYDGSDRKVLVQHLLIMPNSLALDFNNNHLYWSDENQVGRTDLSGNDPHIIFQSSFKSHFYNLALYDSHLYLTDRTSAKYTTNVSHIIRITTNGTNPTTIFTSQSRMNGFRIYSTTTYPTDNTVVVVTSTKINRIYRFYLNSLSHGPRRIPADNIVWPMGIDYDPVDDRIYWTELTTRKAKLLSAFLNGTNTSLVRGFDKEALPARIALDYLARLLFYSDNGNDVIARITLSTLEHKVVISTNITDPRDIVLDTMNGAIFWVDATWPRIERANYDGRDRRVLVTDLLKIPEGLAMDPIHKYLYWTDGAAVGRTDLSGNTITIIFQASSKSYFYDISFHNNYLYITDWTSKGSDTNVSHIVRIKADGTDVTTLFTAQTRMNCIHIYSTTTIPADGGIPKSKVFTILGGVLGAFVIIAGFFIGICSRRTTSPSTVSTREEEEKVEMTNNYTKLFATDSSTQALQYSSGQTEEEIYIDAETEDNYSYISIT